MRNADSRPLFEIEYVENGQPAKAYVYAGEGLTMGLSFDVLLMIGGLFLVVLFLARLFKRSLRKWYRNWRRR